MSSPHTPPYIGTNVMVEIPIPTKVLRSESVRSRNLSYRTGPTLLRDASTQPMARTIPKHVSIKTLLGFTIFNMSDP